MPSKQFISSLWFYIKTVMFLRIVIKINNQEYVIQFSLMMIGMVYVYNIMLLDFVEIFEFYYLVI